MEMSWPLSKGRMGFPSCGKPFVHCWRGIGSCGIAGTRSLPAKAQLVFPSLSCLRWQKSFQDWAMSESFLLLSNYLYCFHSSSLSSSLFFFNLFTSIGGYCFTILWWFLPYISMNQPWVYMCPLYPEPPPTSLPTLLLQVVTEHWLWVPCFVHQACTDYLF